MNSASAAVERLLPDLDWVLDEAILTAQQLGPVAAAQQRWQLRWERRRAEVLTQDGAIGTAVSLACRQGFVLTRQQALSCGLSAADIRRLGRRGWATPRRGMLSVFRPSDRDDRHALSRRRCSGQPPSRGHRKRAERSRHARPPSPH